MPRISAPRKSASTTTSGLRPTISPTNLGATICASRLTTIAYQTNQAGLLNILDAQNMSLEAEYALFDALSEFFRHTGSCCQ